MALYIKKRIMTTFQAMLEKLPFDKITAAALVKRAGISPNTARNQPFNENMLRPCPVLDNPGRLTQMVEESVAHSTDLQSPERACDYCNRCIPAAEKWAPVADEIWNSLPNKRGVQLTGKMAKKS